MSAPVVVERSGLVTTISLDRPQARNAVDGPAAAALAEAFRAFDADGDAAVADLKALGGAHGTVFRPDGDAPMGPTRMRLDKPVIAAVEGYAVAGGLELALWCDLRVAGDTAVFGVFCRRWGVPLIDGGTVRLPRLIGHSRAMDLILTGRPVGAAEAERIGLVNRLVPAGQALATAQQLASELAALPQTCLRRDRAAALDAAGLEEEAALATEFRHGQVSLSTDALAGARRFADGAGRHGAPAPVG
jgi:enoyl-CoA hydratase